MIVCQGYPVTARNLLSVYRAALAGRRLCMRDLQRRVRRKQKAPTLDIREVRAELIRRGLSLSAWARGYGKRSQYVQLAVRGQRRGPIARGIVEQLKAELGL